MTDASVPVSTAPAGPVETRLSTFLLTDIEGSTRLWETHGEVMGAALAVHDDLLRAAIESHGGTVVKTTGDGMLAVFDDTVGAVDAALAAQRTLRDTLWGATGPLRVRMAIHSGTAESRDGDYFGPALNRDARILAIGHGGQILLSAVTAVLSRERLPRSVDLLDLGSHRLRDLDRPEQVFQIVAPNLPAVFPPLRSLSTRRSNLPVQLTSFVGRDRERVEIEALLNRARLVTLIGTGGTGKTRLMLEAASAIAPRFPDGVWLAELAPLGDAGQIATEVARALGVQVDPEQPVFETITEYLAAKDLLLLLDNAEHLIDGVADTAERLLSAAPGLRILATSREALALPGEAVVQVSSLSCPGGPGPTDASSSRPTIGLDEAAGTEAVRLFTERASSVLPSFELTESNVGAVAEICRRLDGIPLALELAAARVSAMSTDDIARGLGDRFRLLAGGRRTAVPRQQTLHALIDWSWDLLTEDDRRMLRRLSIFVGGWTAEAAARVVADPDDAAGVVQAGRQWVPDVSETLDGLARLVDRSLVILDRGSTARYRMLETIRQYAREQLIASGELPSIADRHLGHCAELAAEAASLLHGPLMAESLDRFNLEAENLGAALEWALESSPDVALRMSISMLDYWRFRVASPADEARVIAAIAVARTMVGGSREALPAERALAAHLLGLAAYIWAVSGRADVGIVWGREAVELARDVDDRSALLHALVGHTLAGIFSGARGDPRALFEESLQLASELEDWWILAIGAANLATGLASYDPALAESLLMQAADAATKTGNPHAIAVVAMTQGTLLGRGGRLDDARARFDEAIARLAELGDRRFTLVARSDFAHTLRRGGLLTEALEAYRQTIHGWIQIGNRGAVANQLENIAFVAIDQGEMVRAAQVLGAAEALREVSSSPMALDEVDQFDGFVGRLRTASSGGDVDAAWAEGRAMSMAEAVALAVGA